MSKIVWKTKEKEKRNNELFVFNKNKLTENFFTWKISDIFGREELRENRLRAYYAATQCLQAFNSTLNFTTECKIYRTKKKTLSFKRKTIKVLIYFFFRWLNP